MKSCRQLVTLFTGLAVAACLTGCEKLIIPTDIPGSATHTFEYLWQQVDEEYAFFDVKGVNWDSVHEAYAPRIVDGLSDDSLFHHLGAMLNELNDGHVNLISHFDVSSDEELFLQRYQHININTTLIALNYLGTDHHSTGGFAHNGIHHDSVIYIRYSSFSNSGATGLLQHVLASYPQAIGAVIDIRQNSGGSIQNIFNILKAFPNIGQLLYTTQIKNGKEHHDFGAPMPVYAPDNGNHTPYPYPVVVLTDRGCYSASSFFALCCQSYNNITVIGDTTGGGLGLPNGGGLPNGWKYRISVTRTLSPDGLNYENGVPPDEVVLLAPESESQGIDNVIERACQIIFTKHNANTIETNNIER